jgi:hypothetical protein
MFVRPEPEIGEPHPELARLLLVVTRDGEADVMTMKAEAANPDTTLRDAVNATLRSVTMHGGNVAWVAAIPAERQGRRGRTLKQAPASVRCSFHWAATASKPQNALRRDLTRQPSVLGPVLGLALTMKRAFPGSS